MARNIDVANQLRQQATGQEDAVMRDYGRRGAQSTQQLGEYGAGMAKQTFGEEYETGGATDRLQRANAAAGIRREDHLRDMSNAAALQKAKSGFQSAGMGGGAARNYLNLYQTEIPVRTSESILGKKVARINKERAKKPGFGDYLGNIWDAGVGIATGNPNKIAEGVGDFAGNVERAHNPPDPLKLKRYNYGGK
jgi:hypothetical protein